MNIKYQVFVSSTHLDLIEERNAVRLALLESRCIPAGMELFPAANETSWNIIKQNIDESDCFLLILAGRYGSIWKPNNKGKRISFTEKEYNYAKSKKSQL